MSGTGAPPHPEPQPKDPADEPADTVERVARVVAHSMSRYVTYLIGSNASMFASTIALALT